MKLVGPHHPGDVEAVGRGVVGRQAHEVAGDLDHQLGARVDEEAQIRGGTVVLPDAVGDGQAHVPLPVGVVGHPRVGAQVVQRARCLLPTVAAALPREHRPVQPGGPGGGPRLVQAAVAVVQQRPGQVGATQCEHRVNEHFVPEHVPAVALPVQAPRGYTRVEVRARRGDCLQHVEGVEVKCQRLPFPRPHVDAEPHPQSLPGGLVGPQQISG